MTIRTLRTLLLSLSLTVACSGCMGGGTMGTGITSLGGGMRHTQTGTSFEIVGRILNKAGKPQPRARITVTSSSGSQVRVTNGAGEFKLPVTMSSGEDLEIVIQIGAKTYRGSQQLSPAGATEVAQDVVIDGDLSARFAEY